MGINIGAFLAPMVAEVVKQRFGFHPAFAVAARGMVLSVSILWCFRHFAEAASEPRGERAHAPSAGSGGSQPIDQVPDWKRIVALARHLRDRHRVLDGLSTRTGARSPTGPTTIPTGPRSAGSIAERDQSALDRSLLTFPLDRGFWGWLDRRGLEPSTPTKMAIGMT